MIDWIHGYRDKLVKPKILYSIKRELCAKKSACVCVCEKENDKACRIRLKRERLDLDRVKVEREERWEVSRQAE